MFFCISVQTVLCLVVSHTFPCSGYIDQVEPTLTLQILSPPTTTIPSSGTSGLGPCPRVPGACSRRWDDEGSQAASSCTSIPGKQSPRRSSSTVIDTDLRFTGWRKVEATGGLRGAGYGRRWGPILPPASKWAFLWHLPVRNPGLGAVAARHLVGGGKEGGSHRRDGKGQGVRCGDPPRGHPSARSHCATLRCGWPYRLSLFFFLLYGSCWNCRYGLIFQCILEE